MPMLSPGPGRGFVPTRPRLPSPTPAARALVTPPAALPSPMPALRGTMQATLDAVVASVAREVRPIVREELVPALERNPRLAREFAHGLAEGTVEGMGDDPLAILGVTAMSVIAASLAGQYVPDAQGNPSFLRGAGVVGAAGALVWLLARR